MQTEIEEEIKRVNQNESEKRKQRDIEYMKKLNKEKEQKIKDDVEDMPFYIMYLN